MSLLKDVLVLTPEQVTILPYEAKGVLQMWFNEESQIEEIFPDSLAARGNHNCPSIGQTRGSIWENGKRTVDTKAEWHAVTTREGTMELENKGNFYNLEKESISGPTAAFGRSGVLGTLLLFVNVTWPVPLLMASVLLWIFHDYKPQCHCYLLTPVFLHMGFPSR